MDVWVVEWAAFHADSLIRHVSDEERVRAERVLPESSQSHVVIARALLRCVIARELDCDPADLGFVRTPQGKPKLQSPANGTDLQFSVSHAHRFGLIGLARGTPLGVDVESRRPERPVGRLAGRFFTDREATRLRSLSERSRHDAFLTIWTAKEALIKAQGETVPRALQNHELALFDDGSVSLMRIHGDAARAADWRLDTVRLGTGHMAAVAVEDPQAEIRWQRLSDLP